MLYPILSFIIQTKYKGDDSFVFTEKSLTYGKGRFYTYVLDLLQYNIVFYNGLPQV